MLAKERLIKEVESMNSHHILKLYELVLTLKQQDQPKAPRKSPTGYLITRATLRGCKGSLSEDIINERNEVYD